MERAQGFGLEKDAVMELPELQQQLAMLEPKHQLWTFPHFQDWVKMTLAQLNNIETALMSSSWDNKTLKEYVENMGLTVPKNQEEQFRLYLAVKGVLGFERQKLRLLETQSDNYEKTKRKILELGRNGDIGIDRSVPAR